MSADGRPLRVAVLMGGVSEERAVSLASGCQVAAALREAGHEAACVDPATGSVTREDEARILEAGIAGAGDAAAARAGAADEDGAVAGAREADGHRGGSDATAEPAPVLGAGGLAAGLHAAGPVLRAADIAFLALHGGSGEDGTVQAVLQASGIAYAGSGPAGCALAMDKDLSKRLFRDAGVATPDWMLDGAPSQEAARRLGLPLVVKPVAGGSSVRLAVVSSAAEAERAARLAAGGGGAAMYEVHVSGREFTVGILDDEALPVVEIEPVHDFFDFRCKYEEGMAVETAPAQIAPALAAELQSAALRVHRLLRLEHFSRVDFLVDEAGRPWCLEANALPGLTGASLLPKAARAAGIEFPALCDRIARLGMAAGAR